MGRRRRPLVRILALLGLFIAYTLWQLKKTDNLIEWEDLSMFTLKCLNLFSKLTLSSGMAEVIHLFLPPTEFR